MATLLTKQNLQDILDKVVLQFNAVKSAQDVIYDLIRDYNIDFQSHLFQKLNSDIEVPLLQSQKEFQETVKDLTTEYSEFGRYSRYKTLFSAIETYCRNDPNLTDKTLNGFLYYNDQKVTNKFNKIYQGINGRYLQARNVYPDADYLFYKASVTDLTLGTDTASPSSTVFNNTTYVATSVDGITFAPFPILMVPNAETTGIKFTVTYSDSTTEIFDYLTTTLPIEGVNISTKHSGIKSIVVTSRTMSDFDFANFTLSFYSNFTYITFGMPTGWTTPIEDAIQLYLGTDETGVRVYFRNTYPIAKNDSLDLYMRINPDLLDHVEGQWTVNGNLLAFGTDEGDWWVNSETITVPEAGFTVTATANDQPDPVSYIFTGAVNTSMSNPLNYTPNGTPTAIDDITVAGTFVGTTSGSVTCKTMTFNTGYNFGTITGKGIFNFLTKNYSNIPEAEFNGNAINQGGNIGTAVFNDSAYNEVGTITNGTFNDTAASKGAVTHAIFNNNSYTTAEFTYVDAIFNDYSQTAGTGTSATFNDVASNNGTVTTAIFNDSSMNIHWVTDATFNYNSKNRMFARVLGISDWYPYNSGTIETPVWVYPINEAEVLTANIHWLQVDNDLGGTITNENYLGYPA